MGWASHVIFPIPQRIILQNATGSEFFFPTRNAWSASRAAFWKSVSKTSWKDTDTVTLPSEAVRRERVRETRVRAEETKRHHRDAASRELATELDRLIKFFSYFTYEVTPDITGTSLSLIS